MPKTLIIDGIKFNLWKPTKEVEEFHPIIKKLAKEIFGQDTVYLDSAITLKSLTGLGAEPDGFVIDPAKKELYIVEIELSDHDPYKHINDQLTRFINSMDNQQTKNDIVESLFDGINNNKTLRDYFSERIDENLHRWLFKLLNQSHQSPKIVVVIEEKTDKVIEACKILTRSFDTKILEVQTYRREDAPSVYAYLFETLSLTEKSSEIEKKEEKKQLIPEHRQSYEKMLAWVDGSVRDLVKELTVQISSLGEINHRPSGTDCVFFRGKPSAKSIFVALLLRKSSIRVRIRTDPRTFKDPKKWVSDKIYFGWFFKQGQERSFDLKEKEQISYAMELIKQSYDISV
jgi:predicted transport protein